MNHRMRGIEEDIKGVKRATTENSAEIKRVEEMVIELQETVKKQDNVVTREEFEAYKRERESRGEQREEGERAERGDAWGSGEHPQGRHWQGEVGVGHVDLQKHL